MLYWKRVSATTLANCFIIQNYSLHAHAIMHERIEDHTTRKILRNNAYVGNIQIGVSNCGEKLSRLDIFNSSIMLSISWLIKSVNGYVGAHCFAFCGHFPFWYFHRKCIVGSAAKIRKKWRSLHKKRCTVQEAKVQSSFDPHLLPFLWLYAISRYVRLCCFDCASNVDRRFLCCTVPCLSDVIALSTVSDFLRAQMASARRHYWSNAYFYHCAFLH